jgi:hypothetical protein
MRIALLYEHPSWSRDLIERARQRQFDLTPLDVNEFDFSAMTVGDGFDLWANRVNAMPSTGRPPSIVAATGHILTALELRGHRVVNGSTTHRIGGSKAAQAALFAQLGLGTPATIGIFRADDAVAAANQLGFPILTKPNVGGSGNGIMRHDTSHDLQAVLAAGDIDLGIDGTGVVQRIIESTDNMIYRVEMLGQTFFYGTKQRLRPNAFNYCAADGCAVEPGATAIEVFTPSAAIIDSAARVMAAADTQVGGVEYILDATTNEPSFYDFNPYSNFITGFDATLGFNPIDRYLDFLLSLG